jgi:hypothetical protein
MRLTYLDPRQPKQTASACSCDRSFKIASSDSGGAIKSFQEQKKRSKRPPKVLRSALDLRQAIEEKGGLKERQRGANRSITSSLRHSTGPKSAKSSCGFPFHDRRSARAVKQHPRPSTQDPRPSTQDPRPRDLDAPSLITLLTNNHLSLTNLDSL